MDILKMIEELRAQLEAPKGFGKLLWGLNRDECLMLVSKIRASLPEQVKSADKLTRESERILHTSRQDAQAEIERAKREGEKIKEEALREAERILEQASLQQAKMLDESEVLRLANEEAKRLLEHTHEECRNLRRGADQYAGDVLEELEDAVSRVMMTIQNGRQRLDDRLNEKLPLAR